MAVDKDDVLKIIAGVIGVSAVGAGIASVVRKMAEDNETYKPDYEESDDNSDDDYDDLDDDYEEDDSDYLYDDYNDGVQYGEIYNDIESAQREFDMQGDQYDTEYLYLDFTQCLKSNSGNWNDVYQESLEEQFVKIQRKLGLYGRNDISDFTRFVSVCFPRIKNGYYVSLPSFERKIETARNYRNADCIYNMVIRPEKSGIVSSVIPSGLDIILIGDLVFRNNIISFVVKGMDLIDENVEKFGELYIQCAAACAVSRNERNLPDYGMEARDLYRPFLTRDMVLSLCEKVYPVENPEKAIEIFEKWKQYVNFRKYFLEVQSRRHEILESVSFINAYSVSKKFYRRNEELYSEHLLDGNKNFIQRDFVLLDKPNDESVEFPLVKIEISKKLSEIDAESKRKRKKDAYEIGLRRFTKMQVALSRSNPENVTSNFKEKLVYLGERVAFNVTDVEPDYSDIIDFFSEKQSRLERMVDDKYRTIISTSISAYRDKEREHIEKEMQKETEMYFDSLDRNLDNDIANNSDCDIQKRYSSMVKDIKKEYEKKKKSAGKGRNTDDYEKALESEKTQKIENIPLRQWYCERNEKLKKEFETNKRIQAERNLDSLCDEKERMLKIELSASIEQEKADIKADISRDRQREIEKKKEKLTERHFCVYFKGDDLDYDFVNPELLKNYGYLIYDERAEKKKIERQEKAIESFYHGYVKNPFLASYLFVPETLGKSENVSGEIEWFGNRLNDSQKNAVRKALASNSVFLLQGPPGTGKTEVIAEITAQYIKQGKKVLISSETHKAIDNVFERLPKIPEIRPLRLIPAMSSKESEYSPEKLVDNLYLSISSRLNKRIRQYENFTEMKNNFSENMSGLRFRHEQLLKLESKYRFIQNEKEKLQREVVECDSRIEECRNTKRPLEEEKEQYFQVVSCMESGNFDRDLEKQDILTEISRELYDIVSEKRIFMNPDIEKIRKIYRLNLDDVREEFKIIEANSKSLSVEQEKSAIRSKLQELRDPDTDEVIEGKEQEYEALRKQLVSLKNAKDRESSIDYSSLSIASLVSVDKLSGSLERANILQILSDTKTAISACIKNKCRPLNELIDNLSQRITDIDGEISEIRIKRNSLIQEIETLNEDDTYSDYRHKQRELRKAVADFFTDFEILEEYPSDDYATAIDIIGRHWDDIDRRQDELQKEYLARIPMYKSIKKYLSDEDILEEDRISYTKKLFDNANVFGMTCTSREFYKESSMKSLKEYKLGDINVRNVGIDVVIIDEVSKSSFLDLLIPVLYGKTVILVGDHRQLPPLYDLKHMQRQDFDGLNPEIIDYDKNQKYTELYEKCFFKELFEKVPSSYKIMLDKQYRCHSDIMDVFNHFYSADGKGLSVGLSNQNDLKQHGLCIRKNGMTIIEPHNHIYFVNCTGYESKLDNDSSSCINKTEAEVTCKLIEMINDEYGHMIEKGELKKGSEKDERKSIGVICTYGDQSRYIRNSLKGHKFFNFSQKKSEKLIVSTVDDFQGDERDIIIVSMVRNPRGDKYSTDFIDQFERINVALSRARCMLVIVGAKDFLSKSSINLPDINGVKALDRHSFPVYREIIRTIQAKGKILQASDVIGEGKHNGK